MKNLLQAPDPWTGFRPSPGIKLCGVYKLVQAETGKIYIGSTFDVYKRRKQHLNALYANRHHNRYLQNAFNQHPEFEMFFWLTSTTPKDLAGREMAFEIEQELINSHKDSELMLNFALDVQRPMLGVPFSDEHRANMSRARKGMSFSPQHLAALSAVRKGRVLSEETKAKIGQAHKGLKRSEEAKANMAAAAARPETKEKMRLASTGRTHTEETRAKMAASKTGTKHSEETRAKLVAAWQRRRQK